MSQMQGWTQVLKLQRRCLLGCQMQSLHLQRRGQSRQDSRRGVMLVKSVNHPCVIACDRDRPCHKTWPLVQYAVLMRLCLNLPTCGSGDAGQPNHTCWGLQASSGGGGKGGGAESKGYGSRARRRSRCGRRQASGVWLHACPGGLCCGADRLPFGGLLCSRLIFVCLHKGVGVLASLHDMDGMQARQPGENG